MRRNHSIIACSRHIYVVLFFAHIPLVVNHTFKATPTERLQHYQYTAKQHHALSQKKNMTDLLHNRLQAMNYKKGKFFSANTDNSILLFII